MSWHVIRTYGRDHITERHLKRAGWRTFRPEQHRFYIDKRTCQISTRPIVTSLMQGYLFVRFESLSDIGRVRSVPEVAYLLGWWEGELFVPAEIPAQWVDDLERAGPKIIGKKIAFKKGHRVRFILNQVSDIISVCDGVDKRGRVLLKVDMLGKSQTVAVAAEHVELAD